MKCMDMNITFALIGLIVNSLAFLAIGVKGIAEKKPFLMRSRWMWWGIMLACFGPQVFSSLCRLTDDKHFDLIFLMFPLMFIVAVAFMWRQMSGYMVFGVTDDSFREAIHAALAAKSISYEERLSKIHLKDQNMDLQVSVQGWMGTAQLRAAKGARLDLLSEIASEMGKYFRANTVSMNRFTFIFYIVIGIMMLVMSALIGTRYFEHLV